MEDSLELANYLPLSFKTPKEEEYIAFLWDAFETNYQAEKYHPCLSRVSRITSYCSTKNSLLSPYHLQLLQLIDFRHRGLKKHQTHQ